MIGLLTTVLLAPVALPMRGLMYVMREIQDVVERELNDPDAIRREMLELQSRVDAGLMDEATYDAAEVVLLARLNAIVERQSPGDVGGGVLG